MMRGKPASSMQKTYDDCYLVCSTAVYFESQNNEAEALRSWRNALDQIYYHNAYRVPTGWRPRSETEKALQESLRQMELQCKERVDLLEALKESREESQEGKDGPSIGSSAQAKSSSANLSLNDPREQSTPGWIGGGSVPPEVVTSAPALPSRTAPKRPSYTSKKSSSKEIPRADPSPQPSVGGWLSPPPTFSTAPTGSSTRPGSRTPSPEKKSGMLRTLRTGTKERPSTTRLASSLRSRPPAAAKAATSAWGTQRPSVGSLEQANGDTDGNGNNGTATMWDPYTRTLVDRPPSRDTLTAPRKLSEDAARSPSISEVPPLLPSKHEVHSSDFDRPSRSPPPYPDYPSSHVDSYINSVVDQTGYPFPQGQHEPSDLAPTLPNSNRATHPRPLSPPRLVKPEVSMPSYRKEYLPPRPSVYKNPPNAAPPRRAVRPAAPEQTNTSLRVSPPSTRSKKAGPPPPSSRKAVGAVAAVKERQTLDDGLDSTFSSEENTSSGLDAGPRRRKVKTNDSGPSQVKPTSLPSPVSSDSDPTDSTPSADQAWQSRVQDVLKHLPKGVDEAAAKQIFNEIVIHGDEVHWDDVAGLDIAKSALKEAVVYPFLRPDLFMGLREPARGMLLFGPPGTGKTMLARAVATESKSTFFAISASSLTSKFLGESEKLVRALFALAKVLAPSIIFVDEIDSLLSARGGGSEHEATRRIKTEFLIQWSDLAKAAAGRETSARDKERGDATRVLVLAATNLPWAIDEAARRRFVRRQYIPLPEDWVRKVQLRTLLGHQKHSLSDQDLDHLVYLTNGFSGSDITALAKDAAMGPLRSLGEKLLDMSPEDIRPIQYMDFESSLVNIRPSVSKEGLKEFEDWAKAFGERGG